MAVPALMAMPAEKPLAFALFAHCFKCSKDSKAAAYVAQTLAERRIAALRFDFTGSSFSSNIGDLLGAAEHLRSTLEAPRLLIGHGLGGAAPFEPQHVAHLISGDQEKIRRDGEAMVDIGGRPLRIRQQFLDDL
jgi:putative redox protein